MKLNLFKKFLLALILLTLVPALLSSTILLLNLKKTSSQLAARISEATDRQASENLESRARQIADDVAGFLAECESDLRLVATLPHSAEILQKFYDSRKDQIWQRAGTVSAPEEVRKKIPRYSSIELIDTNGKQLFVIQDGRRVQDNELKDVSIPANTRFRSETYFRETARLKKGEVFVSHLTGFHLSKPEQLGNAPDSESAYSGKEYAGVIRFGTPIADDKGGFGGIIVISLDHRHLMEFSQHVQPGKVEKTVFPSYKSGNYAFIFDDEGWIITHPNFWDFRGLYPDGTPVPPYTKLSTSAEIREGRIPFNLDHAGFIHPNYPVAARAVRQGSSGYVDTTNVGGARKIMSYAPIPYSTGSYGKHGIFGGVTIGFQTDLFHEPSRTAARIIHEQMHAHLKKSGLILSLTTILALLAAWLITRGITRPLALLTEQARRLADGSSSSPVEIASGDEVGELAKDFNRMATELETRNSHLIETMKELDRSRQEVIGERNFMEGVVDSISSAILPFSREGLLISANSSGRQLFGESIRIGAHFRDVFASWPGLINRIEETITDRSPFGRSPFSDGEGGDSRHFDIGIFPIGVDMEQGITVTIRDETEKEELREEMTRMDRLASLGKLSAGIAHEIRNPLTGITLLLDDLHDSRNMDKESREMMGRALSEIERVEKLINALLTYASPPRSEFMVADINRVIEDTLLFFRKSCEKEGVTLASSLALIQPFTFDPEKIRQVLLNLLRNSLNATGRDGIINVTSSADEESVVISVKDSGQGIAPADIPLVFEPFFTKSSVGTGLGLSITQRIVEEHHGVIEVKSEAGEGTTFTVKLPLKA